MNSNSPDQRSALRTQLEESRKRVDALSAELRGIDAELGELDVERRQHDVLREVCSSLDKLNEQGVAELFWDGIADPADAVVHMNVVRARLDAFDSQLQQIEAGRQAVLAKLANEQDNGDFIEDDLLELERLEEERKNEWIVERELDTLPTRLSIMPWARNGEADQRLRKSLAIALFAALFLGVVFPWIPLPLPEQWEPLEVPDRFTQLIREEPIAPQPVQELLPESQEPLPTEEPQQLADEGTPEPVTDKAEPKAGTGAKGILAFRKQFASLADSNTAKLGSQARITRAGELASGRPTRSLVATNGPGSSGGIDLANLSRDVGGGGGDGMEGVQTTRATSAIGAVGGGNDRPLSGGPGAGRTDEEIQIVFDRHKAALYRLYNRELRRNPTLKGQIVLRMTIEPDGSVSLCEVSSSDMKAPKLAGQVVERVKTFDFGAKEGIPPITILYPIDFLPAT